MGPPPELVRRASRLALRRLRRVPAFVGWAALVLGYAAVEHLVHRLRDRTPYPAVRGEPTASTPRLRVATWNLRHLGNPHSEHDETRLRQHLFALDTDLLAVQEVHDERVLERVLADASGAPSPALDVALSRGGGRGEQRLGFVWRRDRLQASGPPLELDALSMQGHLRPGFAQAFVLRGDASQPPLEFLAVTVHLKAKPEGAELRGEQWARLRQAMTEAWPGDGPVLLLGDFNATGSAEPTDGPQNEVSRLRAALGQDGFEHASAALSCTSYWEGQIRDRILEPSVLDMVWVRGPLRVNAVKAGLHCSRHSCQNFRSSPDYPDLDYERISDHCPVVVDLEVIGASRKKMSAFAKLR